MKQHYAEDIELIVHAESVGDARAILDKLVDYIMGANHPALVSIETADAEPELLTDYECLQCKTKK